MTLTQSRAELRRKLLEMQLDAACRNFATVARRLGDHAQLVALLESELSAVEVQSGRHRPGPSRRELAKELALGELAPLRPHPPFVSEESTEQARAALMAGAQ